MLLSHQVKRRPEWLGDLQLSFITWTCIAMDMVWYGYPRKLEVEIPILIMFDPCLGLSFQRHGCGPTKGFSRWNHPSADDFMPRRSFDISACNDTRMWHRKFGGFHSHGGTPKWMVYNGKSHSNGWFRGTPIYGNPHVPQPSKHWFFLSPSWPKVCISNLLVTSCFFNVAGWADWWPAQDCAYLTMLLRIVWRWKMSPQVTGSSQQTKQLNMQNKRHFWIALVLSWNFSPSWNRWSNIRCQRWVVA